jgi:methylmalonyl-CoA epimerase
MTEIAKPVTMKKLNHVSIAVEDVDQALEFYRDLLGLEVTRVTILEDRQLKVAFVKIGETELELLEPLNQDNTVRRYLDRWGPGLHHICLEVDDVAGTMQTLKAKGAEFTDSEPRPGAVGQVAFIHPNSTGGVLVEINQLDGWGTQDGAPRTGAIESPGAPVQPSSVGETMAGSETSRTIPPTHPPTETPPRS